MKRRITQGFVVVKLAVLSSLLVAILGWVPGMGQFNRATGLIDIPTAYVLPDKVLRIGASGSIASAQDPYPRDVDLAVAIGFGSAEVALSAYTTKDYSANLALRLMGERRTIPALAIGVQEITYRKWISSVGEGDTIGFPDDVGYSSTGGRPSERFSAYLVATKDFHPFGSYTLGIGRGRFVGYGPRSHWLNTDNLFRKDYTDSADPISDIALGLFMGAGWQLFPGLSLMVEFDGRDFNTGMKYCSSCYQLALAATKLEWHNPRVVAGASVNIGL